uniref:GAT domain-containing protein n=1 Tax=Amphora coffeiformis TaxID=265554 RepID=A0A7S3PEF2_9STRA|mmetsp:Transcript_3760/g.7533  ORF Transcript_3760/g.7533 Transcript_3760/m.7533 type:complete len:177 (+) Transcript_3760:64-594(+)|eukprot:scaffold1087_cov154-Amphora_coffeaeformis.AAC.7
MATAAESSSSIGRETADAKIMADLNVLKEKMSLCEQLLPNATAADDGFLGVVGFLEACAPRVVDLVEAAAQGALGEAVLMECLGINDQLTALLTKTDAKLPPIGENVPSVAAAITLAAAPEQTEDLLFNVNDDAPTPPPNAKTTGEEDPFGNQVLSSQSKDEAFDDFFQERAAKQE